MKQLNNEESLQSVRELLREAAEACQDFELLDLVYKLLVSEAAGTCEHGAA